MICDIHVHLCPEGAVGRLPKLDIPAYEQVRENTAEDYLALADKKGVSKAVIFPHVYPELPYECTTPYILSVSKKYPDHFIPFLRIDENVDKINLLSTQIMGIKEHFLLTGKDIDSFLPHYETMQSKQLFLISHPSTSSRIERMRKIASNFPHLNIILAHCGRVFNQPRDIIATEVAQELKPYNNIYFDTSTVRDSDSLTKLITKVGSNRVLFGSDMPFGDSEISDDYASEIRTIMKCSIASDEKQNILFKNFRELIDKPWIEKQNHNQALLNRHLSNTRS